SSPAAATCSSRRSLCRIGVPANSRPSQERSSRIPCSAPSAVRSASVSSIRSSNSPPSAFAASALATATTAEPRWSGPVGEGAKRRRGGGMQPPSSRMCCSPEAHGFPRRPGVSVVRGKTAGGECEMGRLLRTVVAGIGVVAAIGAVAPAASLAGAAPPSTVTVPGTTADYRVSGHAVQILTLADGQCRALSWVPGKPAGAARAVAASSCANARTPSQSVQMAEAARGQVPAPVVSGALGVAVTAGALDAPQMLVVRNRATGGILHRWPLPDEVSSLAVGHGIAVLSTVRHQGLYAVRLSDGRMRIVGLMGWLDRPVLTAAGIVFRDDMYGRRNERRGQSVLQLLRWADVSAALDDSSRSYSAPGAQAAWAYDGQRVVMAMRDPAIPCDRVHFWNVAWDRRVQLTQVEDHICPAGRNSHVVALGLGGVRAAWLVENPAGKRWLISATIVACEERVVARAPAGNAGASMRGLVGDGGVVAFSAIGAPGVQAIWRAASGHSNVTGKALVPRTGSVALSADDNRVAALDGAGQIEIRHKFGALEATVSAP